MAEPELAVPGRPGPDLGLPDLAAPGLAALPLAAADVDPPTPSAATRAQRSRTKLPAHRPSRRHLIVDAAIRAFAKKGYTDTSIQDIAEEADVVPTAVYYHFSGKDELFDVALTAVLRRVDEVVEAARGAVVTGETLGPVIHSVWDWIEANPDEAKILYTHLPGATEQARLLRREFEERHIRRAFDYTADRTEGAGDRSPASQRALAMLSVRTLVALLMNIHPLRLEDGPLSKRSPKLLRSALVDVSLRLVRGSD